MRLTKSGKLVGYIVAQYIDGDAKDPIRTDCVDLYIEDGLPKHRAYIHRRDKVNPHHDRYKKLQPILTIAPTLLGIATLARHS